METCWGGAPFQHFLKSSNIQKRDYKGFIEIVCPALCFCPAAYPQMPLSDTQIRNLKPGDKAYMVSDFEGLFQSGSKSWRLKYRIDGKEKLFVIGDYPAISLAQARKAIRQPL